MSVARSLRTAVLEARLGGAALIAVALSSVQKVFDPDVFWHIRAGRWLWEHHALPTADPFSDVSTGRWEYADVVAGVVFFVAHRALGAIGLQIVTALIVAATAGVVLQCCRDSARGTNAASPRILDVASALTLAVWGAACRFRFGPKADLFAFLAFAALLLVLSRVRSETPYTSFWVLPILVVWGNCHRSAILGDVTVALAACRWAISKEDRPRALPAAAASLLGLGAVSANASGVHALASVFDVTTRGAFRAEFPEWAAMPLAFPLLDPAFGALLVTALAGVAIARRFYAVDAIGAALVLLSIYSVRFVPFAATALVAPASVAIAAALRRTATLVRNGVRPGVATLAGGVTAIAIVGANYVRDVPPGSEGLGLMWWRLPVDAARFLAAFPPPGRFWNSFNLGGYLLYALGPEQKVFIDGRNDTAYSPSHFIETIRAGRDPATFFEQIRRFGVTTAVLECASLECVKMPWVTRNPEWPLVHWDDRVMILVHREPRTSDYVARHAYRALAPADALHRVAALGTDPDAAALEGDVMRYVDEEPSSIRAQYLAARVHLAHGRLPEYAASRARFIALVEERGATLAPP